MSKNQDKVFSKTSINWYPGHMAKTKREIKERINLIDIIYEVVDARMPVTSKIKDMEDIFRDKPRILVMTKKDLCDLEVTSKWIKMYEEKGINVIAMDLTNNTDYKNLIQLTKKITEPIQSKRKAQGLKAKEIKVGVVGIPNVGKSTLINKLAGRKVAKVGNKPGVTTSISWIKTDCGLLLLDTPGILWPKMEDNDEALRLASTGTIKLEILNITDIGGFLVSFFKNHYPEKLIARYKIEPTNDFSLLMERIAQKLNYFTKDGNIDLEKTCQTIYNDLLSGALTGVTFDIWQIS